MKKINKSILYYIMVGIIIIGIGLITEKYLPNYNRLVNLIIWAIIFTILQFSSSNLQRYQNVNEKIIYTILIMVAYYIAYFSLGFFYGYSNNPYSQKINAIIENIVFIIGLALLQEYTRYRLINKNKSIISYITITIFFTLFSIEFLKFPYYFRNMETGIEYIFGELIITLIKSFLLTYLALNGGIKLSFVYTIINNLGIIFMPILPKLNWFVSCVLEIVTALVIFLMVRYFNSYRSRTIERKEITKLNPIKTIPVVMLLTIFTLFVAGVLPYKPVAVMSNSMVPVFSRGDIIIIKKIKEEDVKYLEEGQVIEYKVASGSSIVHRIQKVDYTGVKKVFTTKGDNNASADSEKVQENQVKGIVKMVIPYIGYPSVYFSQYVLNVKPIIDT